MLRLLRLLSDLVFPVSAFTPRPAAGKSGSPAAAHGLGVAASAATILSSRPIVQGAVAAVLARMEAALDPHPTRDSCPRAPNLLQSPLDLALKASSPGGQKCISKELGELNLGLASNSWRIEDAGFQCFGTNCLAIDEKSSSRSRGGKTVGGVSARWCA